MKCTITYYDAASQRVEFTSIHGNGTAYWTGVDIEPGTEVDVELGLTESLVWEIDALEIDSEDAVLATAQPAIRMEKGKNILTGTLAGEGPDGECMLRIGQEEVEFEAAGQAPRRGALIQLKAKQLVLYSW